MFNHSTLIRQILFIVALFLTFSTATAYAQVTSFTHQGILSVPDGSYEFEFRLFDAPTVGAGTQQGSTIQKLSPNTVAVTGNAFAVQLDFGAGVFTGAELYLETSWRVIGGAFTVLSPRERITAVYANRSLWAATADAASDAAQLGGLPASGFVQNTTTQQPGTSFNIGGTGSASVLNATTQFNLNGVRILATGAGSDSLFAGINAGAAITTGYANSFFGNLAGYTTTSGERNSFFGASAGRANTTGIGNAFFGFSAGFSNTTASGNSFFGIHAGTYNLTGEHNAFFGQFSGYSNNTGSYNSFFGSSAGTVTTTGYQNTFIGAAAGLNNTTGTGNTFVGNSAGTTNTTGSSNTTFGNGASVATANLNNATAIGANAQVSQSNSLVLGSINGVNWATADTLVGIGTTAPAARLHVRASSTNAGDNTALFAAPNIGPNMSHLHYGSTGDWYIRSAASAGRVILQDSGGNVGIGTSAPATKLHISGTGIIRARINSDSNGGLALTLNDLPRWSMATVTGGQFQIFNDATGQNAVWIASATNNVGIGTTSPIDKLTVAGTISFSAVGSAGGVQLCRNLSNQISHCSSSLRYKNNIAALDSGLQLINRLRPVTFDWKESGERDLGLVAEEVANVEPLLVTRNAASEIEGVKYDRISVALVNAVKQQQAQITLQAEQIQNQQREIAELKRLVCLRQPRAATCRAAKR